MAIDKTTAQSPEQEMAAEEARVVVLQQQEERQSESLTQMAIRRLKRDYLTQIALFVLILMTVLSLGAGVISDLTDVTANKTNIRNAFQPIGAEGHILGTDDLGRDHLARLLYAGRISLGVAFFAGMLSLIIGVALGLLAGYNRGGSGIGLIDDLLMWFITTLNSVPYLFLLLVISAVLSPSVPSLILIIGGLSWTSTMRLVRGEAISQKEREYVIAAQAIGAGSGRIMFSHILPNIFSVLIINLALDIGIFILLESALSFLNLGVRPPTPSWGNMLANSQEYFRLGQHLFILPGVLIVTTVLCLYLIGDGLRDAFDPRSTR